MKHLSFVKKAAFFAILCGISASSVSGMSYSKNGCVSRTTTLTIKNPKTNQEEKATFNSKQIYCHTVGFRQTPVAVIFYGQSTVFPPVDTGIFIEFSATEKVQILNGVDLTTLAPARSLASLIHGVKTGFGFSNVAKTLVKFPNPAEAFYVEVAKESDYTSPGSSVLCVTVYGESSTIPAHLLTTLTKLIAPNAAAEESLAFPLISATQTRDFALKVLDYATCKNLPATYNYWLRPQNQQTWGFQHTNPITYSKDALFVLEDALYEKLDVVLRNCVMADNCYNQDGKQCRIIFAWESDVIAAASLIRGYAQQLNENHWNLVVLNDLQQEYTSAEYNKVLDAILNPSNKQIITKTLMVETPMIPVTNAAITEKVAAFCEVTAAGKISHTTTTFSKQLPVNEAILRLIGQFVGDNTKAQPGFQYK